MTRSLLLALVALLLVPAALAQSNAELRRVVLVNGTVLVGTVADETADPVVVVTNDGVEQRVPRARVAEITPLIDGRFFRVDPTRTRLVLSPTGRTLGGGRTRVGTLFYVVPNATVGVTDRFDVSGTAFVSFGGDDFAIAPVVGAKLGLVDTGSFAAAVGTNVGVLLAGGDGAAVVTPYAAVTIGSELRSVSASVTGFIGGELGGDFVTADGVLLSFGGELQVNNGLKLLLDALVPVAEGDNGAALLPGVRLFGDRYSVDVFGAIGIGGDGQVGGFAPLANFAFTF